MRVLVTGASGMLGSTIVERWSARHDVFATGGAGYTPPSSWKYFPFDLRQPDHAALVAWASPEAIVHCAACTAVDACEEDPETASSTNGLSVERLAKAAPSARILYISSDAVIGERQAPASETSTPTPVNAYGRSKLLGEQLLAEHGGGLSVRTTVLGWNLDPRKQSFVEWLVHSLERKAPVTLFRDALFNPIAASSLGDELEHLLTSSRAGVCHVSGHDAISKLEFGRRICERLALDDSLIRPGSIADVRFVAARTADQRLDVSRFESEVGHRLPTTEETIDALVRDRPKRTEISA